MTFTPKEYMILYKTKSGTYVCYEDFDGLLRASIGYYLFLRYPPYKHEGELPDYDGVTKLWSRDLERSVLTPEDMQPLIENDACSTLIENDGCSTLTFNITLRKILSQVDLKQRSVNWKKEGF